VKDAIKALALLTGAYFVYQYIAKQQSPAMTATPPPTAPAPSSPAPAAPQDATKAILQTADVWNWYRQQATGQVQPEPEKFGFVGEGRGEAVTEEEYNRRRAAAGLSGAPAWWRW